MDVARQCLGYLVAHLEAEAGAIEIQIELVVLVTATEARGVQRYFQGKVVVVELVHRGFIVGL